MPGYGRCYWVERTPRRRRPTYRAYRGDSEADVAVIGGGLMGCVAAFVLASAGLDVVLLEADRLAGGSTATGLGIIQPDPAESFSHIAATLGKRVARTAWSVSRRSAFDLASAIRRLPGRASVEASSLVVNARLEDQVLALRREQLARRQAGLRAPWIGETAARAELGTVSKGAVRLREVFLHDPVGTTLAFARSAEARGARLHEQSPVRRTRFGRRGAEVVLAGGTIRTRGIFVATGTPGVLFGALRRHVRERDGFAVVTEPFTPAMRREAGRRTSAMSEIGADPRWLRWLPDHRALFAGALSAPVPARQRDRVVVQRTGQLMYELSIRYPVMSGLPARWAWRTTVTSTLDGLPWVGPHRNFPYHYFAFAPGATGDAMAWFAARAALRHFTGAAREGDEAFVRRG